MIINLEWLKEQRACNEGTAWFKNNFTDSAEAMEVREALLKAERNDWAEWLTSHAWRDEPSLLGPNSAKVIAEIERIGKIQWLKPQKENRVKVAALIQEHCRNLAKFGCPQDVPVKFTNDLAAAWAAAGAAAWDAARDAAWDAARDAARDAAWAAAWAAAGAAAWDAARDAARDAAWAAARDAAWAAARAAARAAAWAAAYLTVEDKLDFGNPFAPLVEVCELGYLPICMTKDGVFLVYEPKIKEESK